MATIVKIRHADECITVEFDGGEIMKIPYGAAGPYRLEAGRSVDAEEYAQLKTESQRHRSKKMALDYLAICPRSAMEMERYLARKGFDHELVREILEGLVNAGYIDDADYAARYISNRCGKKVIGKNLLMNELLTKGISRNIARDALKEAAPRLSSFEDVLTLAERKYAGMKDRKKGLSKLAYFLRGRGFDHDTVSRVIDRLRRGEEE